MHSTVTIRIKAIFLLVIFSLNSIMGFACSIGLNLGYNQHHHTKEQESSSPVDTGYEESESFDHCAEMEAVDEPDNTGSPTAHDCCKDEVLKFSLLDKSVSSSIKIDAPAHCALDVAAMYFLATWSSQHISTIHYYVQSDHPPISRDLRIAMQSFQI